MLHYFLRRIALIPLTFLVITFMVYTVLRVAPGGPIEQAENALKSGGAGEVSGGGSTLGGDVALSDDEREQLAHYYNVDRAIPIGYMQWLGLWPKDRRTTIDVEERQKDPEFWARAETLHSQFKEAKASYEKALKEHDVLLRDEAYYVPLAAEKEQARTSFFAPLRQLMTEGVGRYDEVDETLREQGYALFGTAFFERVEEDRLASEEPFATIVGLANTKTAARSELDSFLEPRSIRVSGTGSYYHVDHRLSGIVQGDFGRSFTKNQPALSVIVSRFPISLYFGLIGYITSWIVCIPLGIVKAVRHRSHFDTITSLVVFMGYSIPGFVACIVLLVAFGGGSFWDVVPLGGFRSDDWDSWWANGEYWRCITDQVHHTLVPLFGFLIAQFASMTVLMKNSLLENLGADYVRTAFAKGLPERRVIFVHALRNSLIPITAGVGHALGLLFAGSFLIEKTCNINGMGFLGFKAITERDFPIILGTLVFLVLIRLVGNMISDLVWAAIDPRIRFQ